MAKHRTHSIEFKRQVAQEFLAGETLYGLAKRHDICRNLIRVWVQKYEAGAFLTSKAPQFLPLSACRPINALAGVSLGLLHPSGNRVGGRLELTRQLLGRASGSHQIDHLSPELRRISGSVTGHQTPQKSTSRVSTKPGQLQVVVIRTWR